ncbi:hypothetical protein RND71_017594 [Anisodus tanguticus]|uniref:Uncharacterized protein n=1 Tax=Anisodus tanguticus TaxID=243964 RepID=A0AAE1S2I5_9SOLA|nr:hypothetical protein RND71_017594 [Anisodus tanguticus]
MSVFDGRKIADRASSLEDEVQVILEEMYGKGVDISPLKKLLTSFFKLATSYDQARSTLAEKAAEVEKSESFLRAKEHLDLVLNEKGKKAEELSAASRSYKEAKKKAESLRALLDAAKKEVEEIKSKVSAAEEVPYLC